MGGGGGGGRRGSSYNDKISRFATDFHLKSSVSETKGRERVKVYVAFSESSLRDLSKNNVWWMLLSG